MWKMNWMGDERQLGGCQGKSGLNMMSAELEWSQDCDRFASPFSSKCES